MGRDTGICERVSERFCFYTIHKLFMREEAHKEKNIQETKTSDEKSEGFLDNHKVT